MNSTVSDQGMTLPAVLVASAMVAAIAFGATTLVGNPEAVMRIEPHTLVRNVGETFDVQVMVDAQTPMNVFAGELSFNPYIVTITGIDYDTSIANLWAVRPWYENGDGTMNFGGGTTARGGFTGTGALITVHFRALAPGDAEVVIHNARIFRHDGLGVDVPLDGPIDSILTVVPPNEAESSTRVFVKTDPPSLDLNNDGKQSVADVSIMMLHLWSDNLRYDLNQDGVIDRADLGMILNAR